MDNSLQWGFFCLIKFCCLSKTLFNHLWSDKRRFTNSSFIFWSHNDFFLVSVDPKNQCKPPKNHLNCLFTVTMIFIQQRKRFKRNSNKTFIFNKLIQLFQTFTSNYFSFHLQFLQLKIIIKHFKLLEIRECSLHQKILAFVLFP